MKYRAKENIVFAVAGKEYVLNPGDEVELDESQVTTRALVERNRIEPLPAPELPVQKAQRPDLTGVESPKPINEKQSKK